MKSLYHVNFIIIAALDEEVAFEAGKRQPQYGVIRWRPTCRQNEIVVVIHPLPPSFIKPQEESYPIVLEGHQKNAFFFAWSWSFQ